MAAIALPQLKLPKAPNLGGVLKSPALGLAGAAVLFAGAIVEKRGKCTSDWRSFT